MSPLIVDFFVLSLLLVEKKKIQRFPRVCFFAFNQQPRSSPICRTQKGSPLNSQKTIRRYKLIYITIYRAWALKLPRSDESWKA